MHRYVAMICQPDNAASARSLESLRTTATLRSTEWSIAYAGPGALLICTSHTAKSAGTNKVHRLNNGSGAVLGTLFSHPAGGSQPRKLDFDSEETRRIIDSGGQHLVDHYWGSYVALLFDESRRKHHVFRDPTGNAPCYHASHGGVDVFFSHIEDCVRFLPRHFRVNRHYLVRWLLFCGLRTRECGLEGLDDMPGGERVTLSRGNLTRALLWNPARIAATGRGDAPEVAAKLLRTTVQSTIDALASCYEVITHKLSGGLDSSIVAGCLAQAPSQPRINYLNFSINVGFDQERLHLPGMDLSTATKVRAIAGHGDERQLARLVAQKWNVPLIERQRNLSIDLSRMWRAPPSISPSMYFTAMEIDDAELELAQAQGTQAFFSGQGGDSVFLATVQPFPAIDYAYLHGMSLDLWPHLVATARLSRDSLWDVLGKAFRHGVLRRRYRSPASILDLPHLLRPEVVADVALEDFHSPAAQLMSSLPPGKQNHVTGVDGAAYYDFVFHSGRHADHVDPLNSQPVWELMLRLPTYTILADGISRGLARRAFADLLPPEVRRRQVKGVGTPFYQQVVRRNRALLRERLMDGLLVRQGYLDRQKLDRYLAADEPFVTVGASRMLTYLAAEIWLEQWSSPSVDAAAAPLSKAAG